MSFKTASGENSQRSQQVCIDLPGEAVRCWRSADHVKVTLRKHRDVFFDINLTDGAKYTVESTLDYYSPRDKRLMRKFEFNDGEKAHLWIGRNFHGFLLLKSNGKILGTFEPNKLDEKKYGDDPTAKPEPLMVVLGQKNLPSSFFCKVSDPYGISDASQIVNPMFDEKLPVLKNYGTEYDYQFAIKLPEINEYVAVAEAKAIEIQPQVLKQLESGLAVEGTITEIFNPPSVKTNESGLYYAIAASISYVSGSQLLNDNSFKETAGYLQENWRMLDKSLMRVRIEKRVVGRYRVVFKGRLLSSSVAQIFRSRPSASVLTKSMPLGSQGSSFLDGGFLRSGRAGLGGIKRIMLTLSDNFRGGAKIQAIGTVIDIFGDANAVYFDEKGSKDLSEFLGRCGVSIFKAAATAAIGSAISALIMGVGAGVFASGVWVILIAALVVAGYVLAATIVDKVDSEFEIKKSFAEWVR